MKKWFFILLAGLSAVSCDGPEEQTAGSLSVSRTSIEFAAAGNTVETVTVTAKSVEWNFTVSPENDWLEVSRTDGGIAVAAADNTESAARTATITVSAKNGGNVKPQDIRVSQRAADSESGNYAVDVDPAELSFEGTDSSVREVVVTTEGDGLEWTLEIDEEAREWLYAEKGDGRFSVTVSDNTGTQERTGIIRVVPDIESVPGKAVRVTQGITLSLTAEIQPDSKIQGNPLVFPAYVFEEYTLIYVDAVGVGFDYRIEYEEGNDTPWVKVVADINGARPYINITAAGNPLEEKRFAELVIFPTEKVEGVEEIRFAIEQEAGRSTLSNLVEDVEASGLAVNWTMINPTRPGIDIDHTLWTVELWSGTVEGDAASWPKKFSGSGDRIYLSFCSTKIEKNDDGIYELPEGTYTVADEEGPMKVKKGYMYKYHPDCCGDSWFFRLEGDVYVAEAPIVGGSMEVSRDGEIYTVTFDFVDDRGYSITGSYTGGLDVHPQW